MPLPGRPLLAADDGLGVLPAAAGDSVTRAPCLYHSSLVASLCRNEARDAPGASTARFLGGQSTVHRRRVPWNGAVSEDYGVHLSSLA